MLTTQAPAASSEALMLHAMMLTCYADAELQEEEKATVECYAKVLPEFRARPMGEIVEEAKALARECRGFEASVGLLEPLKQTPTEAARTFYCCVELALSAEGLSPAEERVLDAIREGLGISRAEGDRISRELRTKLDAAPRARSTRAEEDLGEILRLDVAKNPWLTLGVMDDVHDPELVDVWNDILAHQTEMLGPSEVAWLREQGFGAERVLEIGSAMGRYGSFIARSFPETRLLGIEANPEFVARAANLPNNYSVEACLLGQGELPSSLRSGVDQVFARYVLQHVSDPRRVLLAARELMPIGGRLFVIEEDDAFFTSTGCAGFDQVTGAWRRICREQGTDSAIGRKLPDILASAGFRVDKFEVRLRTSTELGAAFFDYFAIAARLFHLSSPGSFDRAAMESALQHLARAKADLPGGPVATYPHVLAVATRVE